MHREFFWKELATPTSRGYRKAAAAQIREPFAALCVGKPKTGRAGLGPVVLTAAEIRRKEELLTNLGEDDEDDFMEDLNIDSFETFKYKSFKDIFSMKLPREPAKLSHIPVKINKVPPIPVKINKVPPIPVKINKIPPISVKINKVPPIPVKINKVPPIPVKIN